MINVVKNGINSVVNNDFSQENVVVQYGYEKRSPIDLLVYCMNVAAKITFLTAPNKISIGENTYELLHPKIQLEFQGLTNLNEKETEIH